MSIERWHRTKGQVYLENLWQQKEYIGNIYKIMSRSDYRHYLFKRMDKWHAHNQEERSKIYVKIWMHHSGIMVCCRNYYASTPMSFREVRLIMENFIQNGYLTDRRGSGSIIFPQCIDPGHSHSQIRACPQEVGGKCNMETEG